MKQPKADLHIHPFLKPYGHSYYKNNNPNDASSGASPWMRDSDDEKDDLVENTAGFAPYRQCDFTSCKNGNVRIVVNSFYPMEQGFLDAKSELLDKTAGKTLANLITEFGKEWIGIIKSPSYNYYEDLKGQMNFAQSLHDKIPVNGVSKYRILKTGSNIKDEVLTGDLLVINSIEGAQSLCNGNNPGDINQWAGVEERIINLKQHPGRPFCITIAHHFYNGLCSHSESLFDLKGFIKGQGLGMTTLKARTWEGKQYPQLSDTEITTTGLKVIDNLLSTANGPMILIDVKHMSELARKEFYALRKLKYPNVPIIYSHGACRRFYDYEINLSELDIKQIALSNGIIGLEMDQRILGYNDALKGKRFGRWLGNIFRKDAKQDIVWAEPYWNSLLLIAETCYDAGFKTDPWKYISIGSDYDGIINPLNEYRIIDKLDDLLDVLQEYLHDYWSQSNPKIPKNTGGEPSDVIYKIGYKNVLEFIEKYFKG